MRKELEEAFEVAEQLTEAVNSARQEAGLKKRWPLPEVVVIGDVKVKGVVHELQDVLRRSCNADGVRFDSKEPSQVLGKEFRGGKAFVAKSLSAEYMAEAFFREFVRAVQASRKKAGLRVQDKIVLQVFAGKEAKAFLEKRKDVLAKEVGAAEVAFAASGNALGAVLAGAELDGWKAEASFKKPN